MKTPKLVVSKVKVQHRVKSPGFYQKTKTNSVNPFFSGYQDSVHQAQFPGGLSSPRDKWKKLSQKAVQAKFFGDDKMSPWTNGPQNIWSLVLDKQLTNSLHSVKFNSAKSDFVLSEAQLPKVECVTVQNKFLSLMKTNQPLLRFPCQSQIHLCRFVHFLYISSLHLAIQFFSKHIFPSANQHLNY